MSLSMKDRHRRAMWLRVAARITVFGFVGVGGLIFIGDEASAFLEDGLTAITQPLPLEMVIAFIIAGVAVGGAVLSWWRVRASSIILVGCSVAMGVHAGGFIQMNQAYSWASMGLPYLAAGVLFFLAWRLVRET
jgi:hypothetical protein